MSNERGSSEEQQRCAPCYKPQSKRLLRNEDMLLLPPFCFGFAAVCVGAAAARRVWRNKRSTRGTWHTILQQATLDMALLLQPVVMRNMVHLYHHGRKTWKCSMCKMDNS